MSLFFPRRNGPAGQPDLGQGERHTLGPCVQVYLYLQHVLRIAAEEGPARSGCFDLALWGALWEAMRAVCALLGLCRLPIQMRMPPHMLAVFWSDAQPPACSPEQGCPVSCSAAHCCSVELGWGWGLGFRA